MAAGSVVQGHLAAPVDRSRRRAGPWKKVKQLRRGVCGGRGSAFLYPRLRGWLANYAHAQILLQKQQNGHKPQNHSEECYAELVVYVLIMESIHISLHLASRLWSAHQVYSKKKSKSTNFKKKNLKNNTYQYLHVSICNPEVKHAKVLNNSLSSCCLWNANEVSLQTPLDHNLSRSSWIPVREGKKVKCLIISNLLLRNFAQSVILQFHSLSKWGVGHYGYIFLLTIWDTFIPS